jgi:hypothetical protein
MISRLLPIFLTAPIFLIAQIFLISGTAAAEPVLVKARPISLDAEAAGEQRVGDLIYRGGLELTSSNSHFGGLSALAVSADGRRLTTLSDRGFRFTLELVHGPNGRLVGVAAAEGARLLDLNGNPLRRKFDADAESLARDNSGNELVGFELRHRLWRYPAGGGRPVAMASMPGIGRLSSNNGLEAVAGLADRRILAIAEGTDETGDHPGWIGNRSGWQRLSYASSSGYKPTAADRLPDGDIILVERSFDLFALFAVRVVRIDRETIIPGGRLSGHLIAAIRQPLSVDNFEGIAARQTTDGRTVIYLVSDDNFRAAQRTLLMMFELEEN